ncbi:MAG TPA: hypothetical protein VKA89_04700 [Solirubrobacterales bacterium]|nr:hypothetical protein [Solirubrobacterales bacterium]
MSGRPAPPTGSAPPQEAELAGGEVLDLVRLATTICDRYRAEFPDEAERYGEAGIAWCRHDNQHILAWAAAATRGFVDLGAKVDWLAGVLAARDFPVSRLARDLEIAADVVRGESLEGSGRLAAALAEAATALRHPSAAGGPEGALPPSARDDGT